MKPGILFQRTGSSWEITWLFEPRDLWVGVFWGRTGSRFDIYVSIVPMLPVRIRISR